VSAHTAGAYTATLLVMVNVIKGGGRAPPPSPARENFTLMIECTPEISGYYSVFLTYHLSLEMQNCLTLESSGAAIAEGSASP
jgi:hypothetical protein